MVMLTIITVTGWPIWPLLFISILGLAILLERTWFLRKKRVCAEQDLVQALAIAVQIRAKKATELSGSGADSRIEPPEPLLEQLAMQSALGKILLRGLQSLALHQDPLQCLESMREAAGPIFKQLNQYLNTLATIATLAPLMGLFGTVLGMIEIFASQGGSSNPTQLAQGISMALYNTAFGLFIAMPALAGWRFLRGMADHRQAELNEATRLFIKANFAE